MSLSTEYLEIKRILDEEDHEEIRAFFAFTVDESDEMILFKFKLWSAHFFPQYFKVEDAPFHIDIDQGNLDIYKGKLDEFVDAAFRGAAKTTRTKLWRAFVICNDTEHFKRFLKIGCKKIGNAKKLVTSIYNMIATGKVRRFYPEIFTKVEEKEKRQETMGGFVTATGVSIQATTVGVEQRGDVEDENRPDELWFDDFETRNTLRSMVETNQVNDNMEEALDGMAIERSGATYTCNYISERGNVHKLMQPAPGRRILDTAIKYRDEKGEWQPSWPAKHTMQRINKIEENAKDFPGEYMNEPSAGQDIYFDRASLDRQDLPTPVKEIGNRKIYANYNPSHVYGTGGDVGGGVGLDHSADVTIDFSTAPARVVSTFADNLLKPNLYGHEIMNQGRRFGECLVGVENNKFDTVIEVLRAGDYEKIYFTEVKSTRAGMPPKTRTYGWNTNYATKNTMLAELKAAVEDGLLELSDPALIAELRSYTRDDLMDKDDDVRLTTRHFDKLIACAIAWQMRKYAEVAKPKTDGYVQPAYESPMIE